VDKNLSQKTAGTAKIETSFLGKFLSHALGGSLALALGFGSFLLTRSDEDKIAELLSGLIVLVSEFIWLLLLERGDLRAELNRLKDFETDIIDAISLRGEADQFQKDLVSVLRERIERGDKINDIFQYAGHDLLKKKMNETWIELLLRLRASYCATNYANPNLFYSSAWGEAALLIQNAKKTAYQENVVIKKVFLIDDDDEMANVGDHLEHHKDIGVQIHYLPMQQVKLKAPEIIQLLDSNALGSIDFGIVDTELVLVWQIDKNRDVVGGQVLFGKNQVALHQKVFDELFSLASNYSRDRIILVKMRGHTRERMSLWPKYREPYQNMDRILRPPDGWLYTGNSQDRFEYAAYDDGSLIGFSIIELTGEVRFAVNPKYVNTRKYGRKILLETCRIGFGDLKLAEMSLKIDNSYPYLLEKFHQIGFRQVSNDGRLTIMNLGAKSFQQIHG
jgi:hypothetical protein